MAEASPQDVPSGATEITWLELFYDLVYVAAIIQLGTFLSDNHGWLGTAQFAALFALLWWAWSGTAFLSNRLPVDNLARRVLSFAQMFAVGNLAIVMGGAFGEGSVSFALAYAAVRFVLVLLHLEVARRTPQARTFLLAQAGGFSVGVTLWVLSAFVPAPWRFVLWGLAVAADLLTVFALSERSSQRLPLDLPRLSERYGQFTLIVLGESFIKTVGGLSERGLSPEQLLFSALAFLFIACVWWSYFTNMGGARIRRGRGLTWAYLHLPLMLGITVMGVGLSEVVKLRLGDPFEVPYRALTYGALILIFLAFTALDRTAAHHGARSRLHLGAASAFGAALLLSFVLSATFWQVVLGSLTALFVIATETTLGPKRTNETRVQAESSGA